MSEATFTSGGGRAADGPFTWGGDEAARLNRVCNNDGAPYPAGNYGDTVAAGYYMVCDDKHGIWMWVKAGEMVWWDGHPHPVRVSLRAAKAALYEAAQKLGVGI